MRHPHRCNNCRGRFTLRRPMAQYQRAQACPHCGSGSIHYDTHKRRERLERKPCHCPGAHYPHRPGSTGDCAHYAEQRAILLAKLSA